MNALDAVGIEHFGAGETSAQASRPWHHTILVGDRPLDVFVLGAYAYRETYDFEFRSYAAPEESGVWTLEGRSLSQQIREIRSAFEDALIIVFPHWGWNYAWKDQTQQELARQMIDAGADIILGHGAHRLQEIEIHRDRWIVYNLGNFLFNTWGRYARTNSPPFSLVARLLARKSGEKVTAFVRLYPIVSDNRKVNFQPRPVIDEEFEVVKTFVPTAPTEGKDALGRFFELGVRPSQEPARIPTELR